MPELYCTEDEALEMLLALKVTKVFGSDGSSNRMLKHAVHAIAASLTKLFNLLIFLFKLHVTGNVLVGKSS